MPAKLKELTVENAQFSSYFDFNFKWDRFTFSREPINFRV